MKQKKILFILSLVLILWIACVSLGIAYAGGVRGIELFGALVSPSRGAEVPIRVA